MTELANPKCFAETWFEGMIRRKFDRLTEVPNGFSISSLFSTLGCMRIFFAGDGSNLENLITDQLFAMCRALGLFSPLKWGGGFISGSI